jgi:Ser/Thr protein kinase RdoA (MazF antagonist)
MPRPITDILADFGLNQTGETGDLDGNESVNTLVQTDDGPVVVKTLPEHELGMEVARAEVQERIRASEVPCPRYYRTAAGDFVSGDESVQSFVDGASMDPPERAGYAFGRSLGKLDRALADEPLHPLFTELGDPWSRGRSTTYVREHYLPLDDNRFPAGYHDELIATLELVESLLDGTSTDDHIVTHVDPNPSNAIYTADGTIFLIDLTLGAQLPGYTLGAAIYWWAHPWQTNRFNPSMAHAIASGYRSVYRLPNEHWNRIAAHTMNHGLMALAIPYDVVIWNKPYKFSRLPNTMGRHQKLRAMYPLLEETLADV